MANDLGVALGLMNKYLQKCITKGWVRVSQVAPKRWAYFVTHEGFVEKSLMVKDHLRNSLSFFKKAKIDCEEIFNICQNHHHKNVGLVGDGDLKDIALLVANIYSLNVLHADSKSYKKFDALVIVDVMNPQETFDKIAKIFDVNKIFTPNVLHISRKVII